LIYKPQLIDTSDIQLSKEILELTERLAENAHNIWARRRLTAGWSYGPQHDDVGRENPFLVPYEDLPESEKESDRSVVMETLKAMLALGYRIEKVP